VAAGDGGLRRLITGSDANQERRAECASEKVDRHRQFERFGGQEISCPLAYAGAAHNGAVVGSQSLPVRQWPESRFGLSRG
jgi:hypothetical protein